MRLFLIDLDGTILTAGRAGRKAFETTLARFGVHPPRPGLRFAGTTDLAILQGIFGKIETPFIEEFSGVYLPLLQSFLWAEPDSRVLPGSHELLGALSRNPENLLLVQTGNMREGARIKLRHFGLDRYFSGITSGDRTDNRTDLLRLGLEDGSRIAGRQLETDRTTVICDTAEEVLAARSLGMRSLCAKTGFYPEQAMEAGPDYAVESLEDTEAILQILQREG